MDSALLEGLLMGLFLSIFIGPVFFLLIETSIKSGIRSAFIMDAGVLASDLLWIVLLYWGIDTYLGSFLHSPEATIIAGIVFVVFGLSSLYNLKSVRKHQTVKRRCTLFAEGFLLNSINPSVALFWLATIAFVFRQYKHNSMEITVFFISVFCTVLTFDTLKFFTAKKLNRFLNEKRQHRLSLITSVILILFGGYMFISSFVVSR